MQAKLYPTTSPNSDKYNLNIFKLKADELLAKARHDYERRIGQVKKSLRKLQNIIERIPDREPKVIFEAEREQLQSHKLQIPFPKPRPTEDAKYTLAYSKPANINVVGSYVRKTIIQVGGKFKVDLAVTMPSHIFQEKDYLNFRYFHKRAYYLACIVSGIREAQENEYDVDYSYQNDNDLQPIVIITPLQDGGPTSNYAIRVILAADVDLFPISRTLPDKSCIRSAAGGVSIQNGSFVTPTPFYNASLRSECSSLAYLKYLHTSSLHSDGFSEACQLGSLWLRQRGLDQGFGPFEWACTMALLMQGGGTKGRPVLSLGYDSYQLFKAMLQYLSLRDMIANPVLVRSANITLFDHDRPMLFDGERGMNILFKMTPWSYAVLKHEAGVTLSFLNDPLADKFDACFITKVDDVLQRFDYVMIMRANQLSRVAMQTADALSAESYFCQRVHQVLSTGLGDRIKLLNIKPPPTRAWDAISPQRSAKELYQIQVGVLLDPENQSRTVDRGPSVEKKLAAADFRRFWGDKAELRRFKDGSILESLIWSNFDSTDNVLKQIVTYVVGRHLGEYAIHSIEFIGQSCDHLLPGPNAANNNPLALFEPVMSAFGSLEKTLRALEGLPLQIRQISAADPQLRYSSLRIHAPNPSQSPIEPVNICVQFEGSARWPDDVTAVQRAKIAFLLKMSELLIESTNGLMARLGLENCSQRVSNIAFLDIHCPSGVAFRLRIHHERELNLLERGLKDAPHAAASREEIASALSTYKRDFTLAPIYTQAVRTMSTRFPLLSPSMRLMKKWRDSHMLSTYISDELIELLTVRTFVHPCPWTAPGSVMTGFLRTLTFVSKWEWQSEPLIVDFTGGMTSPEIEAINLRFEAWRKIDPAMNRVSIFAASNLDPNGTTWIETGGSKVVAARFTSLAKTACGIIKELGTKLEPEALFEASMADYDFVIQLNPRSTRTNSAKKRHAIFENVQIQSNPDQSLSGFDPVQMFLGELRAIYGSSILFFCGEQGGSIIAGLWNPQTGPRPWKVNLPYSTRPNAQSINKDSQLDINKAATLHDIASLGGELVSRIDIKALKDEEMKAVVNENSPVAS
ncbi:pre-rRNA processing protein-like protein Utp22 [Usnea florida]